MRKIIRKLLLTLLTVPTALCAQAQGFGLVRGNCTPDLTPDNSSEARSLQRPAKFALKRPTKVWDATKTYKQLVILVGYMDMDFQDDDPREHFDQMMNQPGYNDGLGPGCFADYFREQSAGLFNLQCDVFGPYTTSLRANPYANPSEKTRNYGEEGMMEALKMMIADNPEHDFKQYDWDGDGMVDQVIYVCAGYCGNTGKTSYGYVWPNTSSLNSVTAPDGTKISNYNVSAERWINGRACGIGTICHEFSHNLGLPDIYPTSSSSTYYSVCDEWDLMDGGNFTNYGMCPPNYTAFEKMYLGWLTPVELTEPTTITGMKSVADGGEVYIVRHNGDEFYLLENKQQKGWDLGNPGRGLLIMHVNFAENSWLNNSVNTDDYRFRYDIVHADNLDYEQWDVLVEERGWSDWANSQWMNNHHLCTSPYPYTCDSTATVNTSLTNTSMPATVTHTRNSAGERLLSKSITNIQMADDGTISFDFMADPTAISAVGHQTADGRHYYNLQGQRVSQPRRGLYIRNGKKIILH